MFYTALMVGLIGGVITLDQEILQTMVSRPLVCGPIIGLLLGDLRSGLLAGALFELVTLEDLPIGARELSDPAIGGVVITSIVITVKKDFGSEFEIQILAFSIIYSFLWGILAGKVERNLIRRKFNVYLVHKAENSIKAGDIGGIDRLVRWSIGVLYSKNFILSFIGLYLGIPLTRWLIKNLPSDAGKGLNYFYFLIPFLGFGVALRVLRSKRLFWFYPSSLLGALFFFTLTGLGRGSVLFFSISFGFLIVFFLWRSKS